MVPVHRRTHSPAELWFSHLYNFSPVLFDIFGVLAIVDMMPKVEYQFQTKMKIKYGELKGHEKFLPLVDYRTFQEILVE